MQIGALFPQTEIGSDPGGLREYARAVTEVGFDHLVTYEHVLGAIPERLPRDYAPYGIKDAFHEPFTLFSFMSAVAPELSFATGILVLPQRQTALVAKQATDVFLKSEGKFRLGVGLGWNFAEFEGLGCDFSTRAARLKEQVEVLRLLWTSEELDFQGRFHELRGVGLNPRPPQPIPIWFGGKAEPALKRAAMMGDGFFPLRALEGGWEATFERMRRWREEAGLSWEGYGIEARLDGKPGWREQAETWRGLGASHVYLATMGQGLVGPEAHIRRLEELGREL